MQVVVNIVGGKKLFRVLRTTAAPPVISAVSATPTTTTAVISWTTNIASSSVVNYGTSAGSLTQTASSATATTAHSLTLTGLTVGTTYYYKVTSVASGASATFPASGSSTFTTLPPPLPSVTNVVLTSAANVYAIFNDGTAPTHSGVDTVSYAYSANLLGSSLTAMGVPFTFGNPGVADAVANATITLPAGNFTSLKFLGLGVEGNQKNQSFVVTYTDGSTSTFTQSISDWFTPQNYSGETLATSMAYRVAPNGGKQTGPFNLYGYSFALNNAKTVKSIKLPSNRDVVVMAITLLPGDFGVTATPASLTVRLSGTATSQIAVSTSGTFTSFVTFAATGLPSGVTASFSPASSAAGSTLTLTAASNAALGTSSVTITGTSGVLSHSTALSVTVTH